MNFHYPDDTLKNLSKNFDLTGVPTIDKELIVEEKNEDECECMNIMVVDDECYSLEIMGKMLEDIYKKVNICVEIDQCYNGNEAVSLFNKKLINHKCKSCFYYKFIIMDMNMPVMDGGLATKEILKVADENIQEMIGKKEYCRKLPLIIGHTAFTDIETKVYAIESGMVNCINKPCSKKF